MERLSKTQVDRLGERLRLTDPPSLDDLELFSRFRAEHDEPLARVERILRDELGLRPTSRLKTVQTTIDKLRRGTMRLSQMQDIAGLRIVEDLSLADQDHLVGRIVAAFPGSAVDDRRLKPSFGYRAAHVIARTDDYWVEVQVRTTLQDLWAQAMESLSLKWGRQIQYGELPYEPDAPAFADGSITRSQVLQTLIELSQLIGETETSGEEMIARRGRRVLEQLLSVLRGLR